MQTIFSPELFTNAGAIVGFLVFVGYVVKQVIDWWRGDKSIEQGWRTAALNDAIAGHNILKDLFNTLKSQVDELEEQLQESKRREAELVTAHRAELAKYTEKIRDLEKQLVEVRRQLRELQGE